MRKTLLCLRNISILANKQLNYVLFILKFKGLSRSGIEYLQWLGVSTTLRTINKFIVTRKVDAQRLLQVST